MKARRPQPDYVESPVDSVGGHPALNFINTLNMLPGELTDSWQSDHDVAAWIVREGLRDSPPSTAYPGGALLERARNLRQIEMNKGIRNAIRYSRKRKLCRH
jgi:predicted RNA-binding Zn ribbon-like protein